MNIVRKQSRFSRSLANEAKLGAYYTDIQHCQMIGRYLAFPDETFVLEPSIGDAKAVHAVLQGGNAKKCKIYGVELNPETCRKLNKNGGVDVLLEADFLTGSRITPKSFPFAFSNPPYGINDMKEERYEVSFLIKISNILKASGVLVYVIPEYILDDKQFAREWSQRFVTCGIYRFHEKEYVKFKQVVLFGIRKPKVTHSADDFKLYIEKKSDISELDENYSGPRIQVMEGEPSCVKYFTTWEEDPVKNIGILSQSPIFDNLHLEEKKYTSTKLNNPVVDLKKDLKYLLAVSGCGQGKAGNELNGDLHLQRGTVKRVTHSSYEPHGDTLKEVVTETTSVCMTIIENDGTITRLES